MPGHARERRPGRWELRVYVGRDPLTGKPRYATKTVAATGPRDADRQLAAYASELLEEQGTVTADGTLGELLESWYRFRAPNMAPKGRREARRLIDADLKPSALWKLRLKAIGGPQGTKVVDDFYTALRERGGKCRLKTKCASYPCGHGGGAPLAASTVHRLHAGVVHPALEQAVTWGLIRRNPASAANPGDIVDRDIEPPDLDDVARLFSLAEPEFGRFVALAAATGHRLGELLALRWDDIDADRNLIRFRHVISVGPNGPERVPKGMGRGKKGKPHTVPVDPTVAALLSAQFQEDARRCVHAGFTLRPSDSSYVFPAVERRTSLATDVHGFDPWRPDSTSRQFRRLRVEAGIGPVRFHDLRHFVVSAMLSAGVDLRTVQEMVGHAPGSPVTMRVYAHVAEPAKEAAAGVMARLLELPS